MCYFYLTELRVSLEKSYYDPFVCVFFKQLFKLCGANVNSAKTEVCLLNLTRMFNSNSNCPMDFNFYSHCMRLTQIATY